MNAVALPVHRTNAKGGLNGPTAEHCSSMRSGNYRSPPKSDYCECCRNIISSVSVVKRPSMSMCASWQQLTAISPPWSMRKHSAKTYGTASTCSRSCCRDCVNDSKISRPWPNTLSVKQQPVLVFLMSNLASVISTDCWNTIGLETFASFKQSSIAP